MKKTLTTALMLVTAIGGLALSGCATDDTSRLEQVTQIRYTGDTQKDLSSLCRIGSTLNGLNNTQRAFLQDEVINMAERFADTSDPNVASAIKGIKFLTSTDQNVRNEGEKVIDSACDKL